MNTQTILDILLIVLVAIWLSNLTQKVNGLKKISDRLFVEYENNKLESASDKFTIRQMGEYAQSKTEHGNTIILFRTTQKYHSGDNHITLGTGVNINIKEGYCGIVQPRKDVAKTGLDFIPFIILPGDDREVTLDFYLSQNPAFKESEKYFSPYEMGNAIGYVTIVKTM